MRFDTKIAVVLRDGLPVWQKLNAVAFLASGVAASEPDSLGAPYEDAHGNQYLPMFGQPVMVFTAAADELNLVRERVLKRDVVCSIFVEELFETGHDEENRQAFKAADADALSLVGLAFRTRRNAADRITKGLRLHR